ncbi:MAG: TIR domain-containing protein [Rhizomicrobium sp.]
MADVFISYAREDFEWVGKLATALSARGLSVWLDSDILAGEFFRDVTDRELDAAACVLVVWSNYSVQSRWVHDEAAEGMKRQALVPITKSPVDAPKGFRGVQTADLSDWRGGGSHQGFENVVRSIESLKTRIRPETARNRRRTLPLDVPPRRGAPGPDAVAADADDSADEDVPPTTSSLAAWIVILVIVGAFGAVVWHFLALAPPQQHAVAVPPVRPAAAAPPPSIDPDILAGIAGLADDGAKLAGEQADAAQQASLTAAKAASRARAAAGAARRGRDADGQVWTYTGQAQNGVPDGYGVKTWDPRPGDKCQAGLKAHYEGLWNGGTKQGPGVMYRCDGGSYSGQHNGNLPNGLGVSQDRDGKVYSGTFVARLPGRGVRIWPDGSPIRHEAGQWSTHGLSGPGVVVCGDDTLWKGRWADGLLTGPAAHYDAKGAVIERGDYGNAEPQGPAAVCGIQPKP